jgi:alpha-galactosidase
VAKKKIPDMAAHVTEVHKTGMKYILWYAVPYVGKHSDAAKKFEGKYLNYNERLETYVLDPRFPDVREYLISIYENATLEYDLDGFKLDFVDAFVWNGEALSSNIPGRDFESVEEAVDKLLCDVASTLKKHKPDMLFEFRQSYIGPAMRKYGNMFRAGDVPNDSLGNRMRILDIRLLSGSTPAHSDMLMWHKNDPVESAALQIVNIIFSVPQISVMLDELPSDHIKMISFYLDFWRGNRDVLLDGKLTPLHPEDSYPAVLSETNSKFLAVSYAPLVIPISLSAADKKIILINGSRGDHVYCEYNGEDSTRNMKVFDCMGNLVSEKTAPLENGVSRLDIPSAGMAVL